MLHEFWQYLVVAVVTAPCFPLGYLQFLAWEREERTCGDIDPA